MTNPWNAGFKPLNTSISGGRRAFLRRTARVIGDLPPIGRRAYWRKELYDIAAKHSGQSYERIHEVSDRDYWMIAKEAKAFGMIDEVLGAKED